MNGGLTVSGPVVSRIVVVEVQLLLQFIQLSLVLILPFAFAFLFRTRLPQVFTVLVVGLRDGLFQPREMMLGNFVQTAVLDHDRVALNMRPSKLCVPLGPPHGAEYLCPFRRRLVR